MNESTPIDQRISESRVATILQLIDRLPGKRDAPRPGDLRGNYDFWFDGGAGAMHTGLTEFTLDDGTRVRVGVVPRLSVTIEFPDGRRVGIEEESDESRAG